MREDPVAAFLAAEVAPLGLRSHHRSGPVDIAGIGTTAPRALAGPMLKEAINDVGLEIGSATAFSSVEELVRDETWQLSLVLSPWKQRVAATCAALSPSAQRTGVVDSLVRSEVGVVGLNANVGAASAALSALTKPDRLGQAVIVGAGASARSVVLGLTSLAPNCAIAVVARSEEAARMLADEFDGAEVVDDLAGLASVDLVVNATTWGETEESEEVPFAIDLRPFLQPGVAFFDLNNRIGSLPMLALRSGCHVASGAVMQLVTHACRAALLSYATEAATSAT